MSTNLKPCTTVEQSRIVMPNHATSVARAAAFAGGVTAGIAARKRGHLDARTFARVPGTLVWRPPSR